jgi:chemotaxis response regulator CheB
MAGLALPNPQRRTLPPQADGLRALPRQDWSEMKERRVLVLFGDSLLMDTVEASLEKNPALGVVRIHTAVADLGERLKCLGPDVVIFDLDTPHLEFVLPFLRDKPGVPLLGLDVNCNKVIALSSHRYTALTAHDLAQVIQIQASQGILQRERSHAELNEQLKELLQRWL